MQHRMNPAARRILPVRRHSPTSSPRRHAPHAPASVAIRVGRRDVNSGCAGRHGETLRQSPRPRVTTV